MSDIANNNTPVQIEGARFRSPVSESLIQQIGGNINYLLERQIRTVEFTTPGAFSWNVPADVDFAFLLGCGGGGGGSGAINISLSSGTLSFSGAGGPGTIPYWLRIALTPGAVVAGVIGAGGLGTTGAGGDGGDTVFGDKTFYGAPGAGFGSVILNSPNLYLLNQATPGNYYDLPNGGVPTNRDQAIPPFSREGLGPKGQLLIRGGQPGNRIAALQPASPSPFWPTPATQGSGTLPLGGGGGGTGFGPGGNGGSSNGTGTPGANAPSTSYGAGGGGGGRGSILRPGGNGAGGYLGIVYFGGS